MKKNLYVAAAVFLLGIIVAAAPLFGKKYIPTHDGEYHIIRIVEFSRMLGQGYLFPRWAPELNSGYGIPIFQYHYPLPNYIGSLVRLVTRDAVSAFQMSMGIAYILMAAGAFFWLAALFGTFPALIGAVAAAFVPYLFVDLYIRGTIGEVWAMAFLFLSLYAIERKRTIGLAFAFGLLVVSHNILAMLFAPFLLLYCILRNRKAIWGMVAGIGLSAFFWLPALLEQRYVVGLNTVNFREHFVQMYELLIPSWGSGFSGTSVANKLSFQIGIAPIIAILGALWALREEKDRKKTVLFVFFLIVFAASVFFMLSASGGIWGIIKPLQLMQYPWRLLSFAVPLTAYAASYWVSRMKRPWIGILFAVLAVLMAHSYARPVLYEPRNEAYYLARQNFTDGTSSMGNSFSTVWSGWKDVRPRDPVVVAGGQVRDIYTWKYLEKSFSVAMLEPGEITVHTLYFPGWKAQIDGQSAPIEYKEDGVIHITVPGGDHEIRLIFTDTPPRTMGNYASIFSLVFLCAWGILFLHKPKKRLKK